MAKPVPMVTKESVYIKVYGHGQWMVNYLEALSDSVWQTQPPDGEFKPDIGLKGGRDKQWQPPPTEHKDIHNQQKEQIGV